MSDVKQVKVDNWGIYFLQRLKHFFNRTDYCDLTLQFQDNAQLKVHRLVLSACTEYFELLERTCEMYEDCLVMPDDLQADVVVPIVNFMYTGQLEFKMDMLEKLYQTSLVMNMPVLSKLLDAHRSRSFSKNLTNYGSSRRNNRIESVKQSRHTPSPRMTPSSSSNSNKRSYINAFQNVSSSTPKVRNSTVSVTRAVSPSTSRSPPRAPSPMEVIQNNKRKLGEPRPTRYELPEELDTENIFENSFSNISYTSTPLMVHPETTKHYPSKKDSQLHKKLIKKSTMEIVECKKIKSDNIFQDDIAENTVHDESDMFQASFSNESPKDPNQLFDQILDSNDSSKVVIETKGGKQSANIDHAKIISEVLKKYPHLVKSNKNIKLKILNTPTPTKAKKPRISNYIEEKAIKPKVEPPDYTYETDVLDSKEAAKLIAMGAENVKGPWICLICGTPGRALHFTSYYKFRRHLVEVHNEKCIPTICEYCGFKSYKRNYMVHHCYTQHGVQPPPQYHFPKCNQCDYIAITEGFLVKHKIAQHGDYKQYRCNVCSTSFATSNQFLSHIQKTGHKYSSTERKSNLQCIYCLKVFLREANLYAHLKTNHKLAAKRDGLVDDSDEEKEKLNVKSEAISYDNESEDGDVQYQIHQRADGVHQVHVVSKKPSAPSTAVSFNKQKILNPGFSKPTIKQQPQKAKPIRSIPTIHNEFMQDEILPSHNTVVNNENVIFIDNVEYVMKNNELMPRKKQKEYILSEMMDTDNNQTIETIAPSTSMQFANIQDTENMQQAKMIIKKSNMNQPIQIVVSNEEEYKALMSSNHSIIFDDGDANKTLTMMSNSHNTSLDTTGIDLDNTQSNDMMIIQDDYPLNVTETVGPDNNIVVVYSHQVGQVDDPNKQYQIITSQDIGAQFIQSSAMITQNYETVTTSTPVMSAHVIDTQVHDSWQNNSHQNIDNQHIQITSDAQLSLTQIKDVSGSLIDLPEVEITALPKEMPAEITAIEKNTNQSSIVNLQEVNQNNAEHNTVENANIVSSNITSAEISSNITSTEISSNIISNKDIDNTESVISRDQIDIIPISENNIVPEQTKDNPAPIENQEGNEKMDKNCEETVEQLIETRIEFNDSLPKNASDETEPMQVTETAQECVDGDLSSNVEPTVIQVAKEQIHNLASEWSDDDLEANENTNVSKDIPKELPNMMSEVNEETHELEESIENIQQEVEKQIATGPVDDSFHSTLNDSTSSDFKEPETISVPPATQPPVTEKLTSLLNDWEDNDSQEENSATENESENANTGHEIATTNETNESRLENAEVIGAQEENGESNETEGENTGTISTPSKTIAENVPELENAEIEQVEPKKVDKIQSLVSDWDDDEEENKE